MDVAAEFEHVKGCQQDDVREEIVMLSTDMLARLEVHKDRRGVGDGC